MPDNYDPGWGAATAAAIDNLSNYAAVNTTNKKSRKYNTEMYEKQRADALADWNMQNEYNHPSAQMRRLREAGLNENLVYGGGATTEAANIRDADQPSWNPETPNMNTASAFMGYYDVQMKEAQLNNFQAQQTVLTQEALLKAAQTANTLQGTKGQEFDLMMKDNLKDTYAETQKESLRGIKTGTDIQLQRNEREIALNASSLQEAAERILSSRAQRSKVPHEINLIRQQIENLKKDGTLKQLDINLKEKGVQPSDALWQRILAQLLSGDGKAAKEKISGAAQEVEKKLGFKFVPPWYK